MEPEAHRAAYSWLAAEDSGLKLLISEHGHPDPFELAGSAQWPTNFAALVMHIMGQQINVGLARVLYGRLATLGGGAPTAPTIAASTEAELRALGLSRAKAIAVRDLADKGLIGQLDIEHLDALDDTEAAAALITVTRVGPWSAEMFLITQQRRQDVLPSGDLSIRRAEQRVWDLPERPTPAEIADRAQAWKPYRTFAAALLWTSVAPEVISDRA